MSRYRSASTAHQRYFTVLSDEVITQQHMKDECDINNLVARYQATGLITHVNGREPQYVDATLNPKSYQEACNIVLRARDSFDALPSKIRNRFANDPVKLLEFLSDSNNLDEAIKLGICEAPKESKVDQEKVSPKGAEGAVSGST